MLEKYCRVDLEFYLRLMKYHQGTLLWMHWVHTMMVMVMSPYADIQVLLWESEALRGDTSDHDNPFRQDKVRLNIPVDPNYPPPYARLYVKS